VARLTRLTRALYRKARETHIATLLYVAHARTRFADRLLSEAEGAQERANVMKDRAFKARDHADLCWDATEAEITLIDVAA